MSPVSALAWDELFPIFQRVALMGNIPRQTQAATTRAHEAILRVHP